MTPSSLAALSPSTIVHDGTIFVALKCYFDGSGTTSNQWLTLGAVAGDEKAWRGLEADWVALLKREGASYMHMREAMSREDEFRGWPEEKRDWLVNALLTLVNQHQCDSGERLRMFTTSVDLVAHAEISARHWLPYVERQ